ncbi:TPA: TonB-dependent receptor [Pseudomonas aeruginosa]|nr:TonB-dependent receptor [Pseudomonas aeruginosa]
MKIKTLKMKLLDSTLICLLAGAASPAAAQAQADAARIDCAERGCSAQDGLLFQVRTRGEREPLTPPDARTSAQLQADRRVDVLQDSPGKAVATGKFSLNLANGGVIWATEDPALGQAELSVSAPTLVAFDGRAITKPVQFYVRSNYSAFVARYELAIYRGSDTDLVAPLATLPLEVGNVSRSEWDGTLPATYRYRTGDTLLYVLRAYDAQGHYDETSPKTLQLVRPEEAERGSEILRKATEQSLGTALSSDQAQAQRLIDDVFSSNGLRQRNIPLYGSRIRIQGRNLPAGHVLEINGESYPVDLERKFAAEYLVPVGHHRFDVALTGGDDGLGGTPAPGSEPVAHHALDVDVTGRYFFGVGLADVTVAQNKVSGSTATLSATDPRYADDVISDGRLAFYGKAKFQGKYLVTAQADTTEQDLQHLFDHFTEAYATDVFRSLDPDLYYPTYGDDASVRRDVDTQGRFYVRVDWDQNQALWGNYSTGFTGTEYGQYIRSLYGAALNWRSLGANRWGDPHTELRVFGSQAQSAPGHSEFLGTGGSLYYLRHTQILAGSDNVVLEVSDRTTGRVLDRVTLVRGVDYEIDQIQGRLLLTRPLAQITRENVPTLTRDAPLDGYQQRLLADYEFVPTGFDPNDLTAGLRAKQWFGDHFALGTTYVEENRSGQDYTLAGGDMTLQAGKGTYLKAEYTRTEALSTPVFFSDNGGFTFTQLNAGGPREGAARAVEARANLRELGWTELDWSAGAWWREVDAGYSVSRYDLGEDVTEYGAEVRGQFTPDISLYARYSKAEAGAESLVQAQATGEWRISELDTLAAEIRRVEETRLAGEADGLLGALKYTRRLGTSLDLYGQAQLTLDDDHGRYADNDAYTVGGKYLFGDLSSVGAEYTDGDRGNAAQVNAEYRLTPEHSLYGAYTASTDTDAYDPLFNSRAQDGWTLGQRWRLTNQINVFNESQFLKSDTGTESGLAHTFGLDFYPAQGWNTGFTLQRGELVNSAGGDVSRRAISLSGGRTSPDTDWQSKLEWRRDTGAEQREQWVSTNRLTHRFNDSWRIAARLNYSDTDDRIDPLAGARFIEGNVGFAWRPWNSLRWGVFGRYTYLYDLATLAQIGGADYDQKTQVFSLEGVYKLDQHWELAAKVARRTGQVRYGRGSGAWFDSDTTFYAGQVRYELAWQWHALVEHRTLRVDDGGTKRGWLVGLDRDIGRNFRIGAGYNFTDFSDTLTDFDDRQRGFFITMTGTY